eukprot:Nk52_evm27s32 gene=Nk52_evmTU27s32
MAGRGRKRTRASSDNGESEVGRNGSEGESNPPPHDIRRVIALLGMYMQSRQGFMSTAMSVIHALLVLLRRYGIGEVVGDLPCITGMDMIHGDPYYYGAPPASWDVMFADPDRWSWWFKTRIRCDFETLQYVARRLEENARANPKNTYKFDQVTSPFSFQVKLAMFMFYCGRPGRGLYGVGDVFGVTVSTAHKHINQVLGVIMLSYKSVVRRPQSQEEYSNIAAECLKRYGFPGVAGIIDGTYFEFPRCQVTEKHVCRYGFPSYNCQIICDGKGLIYSLSFIAGSENDAGHWKKCNAKDRIIDVITPAGLHLIRDGIYALRENFLVPYDFTTEDAKEILFNAKFSRCRTTVERTIGLLKIRFGILTGMLPRKDAESNLEFIEACCTLHNLIMECSDGLTSYYEEEYLDIMLTQSRRMRAFERRRTTPLNRERRRSTRQGRNNTPSTPATPSRALNSGKRKREIVKEEIYRLDRPIPDSRFGLANRE